MLPPSPSDPASDLAAERARLLANLRRSATTLPEPAVAPAPEGSPARGRGLAEEHETPASVPPPAPPDRARLIAEPSLPASPPTNQAPPAPVVEVPAVPEPPAAVLPAAPAPPPVAAWTPVGMPAPEVDAPLSNDAQAQLEAYLRSLEAVDQKAARPRRGPSIQNVLLVLVVGVLAAGLVMVFREPSAPADSSSPVPPAPRRAVAPGMAATGSPAPAPPAPATLAPAPVPVPAASPTPARPAATTTRPGTSGATKPATTPLPAAQPAAPAVESLHSEAGQKALEAAGEAAQARRLNDEVDAEIDRYAQRARRQPLTAAQADSLKRSLRAKCRAALDHANRALALDPRSLSGWVQRIRALRLTANYSAAQSALREALALYPGSADLKAERELVGAGEG